MSCCSSGPGRQARQTCRSSIGYQFDPLVASVREQHRYIQGGNNNDCVQPAKLNYNRYTAHAGGVEPAPSLTVLESTARCYALMPCTPQYPQPTATAKAMTAAAPQVHRLRSIQLTGSNVFRTSSLSPTMLAGPITEDLLLDSMEGTSDLLPPAADGGNKGIPPHLSLLPSTSRELRRLAFVPRGPRSRTVRLEYAASAADRSFRFASRRDRLASHSVRP